MSTGMLFIMSKILSPWYVPDTWYIVVRVQRSRSDHKQVPVLRRVFALALWFTTYLVWTSILSLVVCTTACCSFLFCSWTTRQWYTSIWYIPAGYNISRVRRTSTDSRTRVRTNTTSDIGVHQAYMYERARTSRSPTAVCHRVRVRPRYTRVHNFECENTSSRYVSSFFRKLNLSRCTTVLQQ